VLLLVGQLRLDGSRDSVSRRLAPSRWQLRLAMRSISMQFRQLLVASCRVVKCVAVCCSVLPCGDVVASCRVVKCVAVCCSVLPRGDVVASCRVVKCVAVCCRAVML